MDNRSELAEAECIISLIPDRSLPCSKPITLNASPHTLDRTTITIRTQVVILNIELEIKKIDRLIDFLTSLDYSFRLLCAIQYNATIEVVQNKPMLRASDIS